MTLATQGLVDDPRTEANLRSIREEFPLTRQHLANDSVGAAQIAAGAVGASELGQVSGARVLNASTQSISNNTVTALAFTSESFDTATYHDNSTNNSRLTVSRTGIYVAYANVGWDSNTTGIRVLGIRINGTENNRPADSTVAPVADQTQNVVTGPISLTANDYIEAFVYQNSGGSRTLDAHATGSGTVCWFSIHYLGTT